MPSGLRATLAAIVLAAVVAMLWNDKLVSGDRFELANVDAWGYLYPAYETTYARLASGVLPLWNPYQLCGVPWLGALQTGVLYPPHALYLVLPTYKAMSTLVLVHLLIAALATFAVARRAGIGLAGAVLAGVLFASRGRLPFLSVVPNMFEAASWLPLGCLAVLQLAHGALRRGITTLAVATGMSLLAGYPQYTMFLLYAWASLLPFVLVAQRPDARGWLTAGLGFGAGIVLGSALAAAQMLPTHELTSDAVRQTGALTIQQMYPIAGPWIRNSVLTVFRDLSLGGNPLSFGIVGLSLFAAVPFVLFARVPATVRALAGWALLLGAFTIGFALGPGTGVFEMALHLPGFAWFRVPDRILAITDFCFAIGAGASMAALLDGRGRLAPVIGLVALVLGWLASHRQLPEAWLVAGGIATLVGLVFVPVRWIRCGVAAGVVGLAIYAISAVPPRGLAMPYTAEAIAVYDRQRSLYTELASQLGADRFWLIPPSPPPYETMFKQATRFRVRTIDDYEPFVLRRQAEYLTYFYRGQTTPSRANETFAGSWLDLEPAPRRPPAKTRRRLLDLAAVRFVVASPGLRQRADTGDFLGGADLGVPLRVGSVLVYPNPHALPRAFVTYRTAPAPEVTELLARLSDPAFDPLAQSYVEGTLPHPDAPDAPARGEPARIVRDEESSVEIDASLAADGLLVLADTYFGGWQATVDGAPAPILPTNHLFRGVPVAAGRHRVRFEYRPWRVSAGLTVSGLALVALAVLAIPRRRRA